MLENTPSGLMFAHRTTSAKAKAKIATLIINHRMWKRKRIIATPRAKSGAIRLRGKSGEGARAAGRPPPSWRRVGSDCI
jgi:hypothetical protein